MTRDDQRHFAGGAVRDTTCGKGRFDLLPPRAIRAVARRFEQGATRYPDRNWEQGEPIGRSYLDSGLRHAFQALQGLTDEDHLVAAAWNLLAAVETRERIREGLLPEELDDIGVS